MTRHTRAMASPPPPPPARRVRSRRPDAVNVANDVPAVVAAAGEARVPKETARRPNTPGAVVGAPGRVPSPRTLSSPPPCRRRRSRGRIAEDAANNVPTVVVAAGVARVPQETARRPSIVGASVGAPRRAPSPRTPLPAPPRRRRRSRDRKAKKAVTDVSAVVVAAGAALRPDTPGALVGAPGRAPSPRTPSPVLPRRGGRSRGGNAKATATVLTTVVAAVFAAALGAHIPQETARPKTHGESAGAPGRATFPRTPPPVPPGRRGRGSNSDAEKAATGVPTVVAAAGPALIPQETARPNTPGAPVDTPHGMPSPRTLPDSDAVAALLALRRSGPKKCPGHNVSGEKKRKPGRPKKVTGRGKGRNRPCLVRKQKGGMAGPPRKVRRAAVVFFFQFRFLSSL